MLPAALTSQYGLLRPTLETLLGVLTSRIKAELEELRVIAIVGRPKESASLFQKLNTGKYGSVSDITDLVGITVVLLYRHEVQTAMDFVRSSSLTLKEDLARTIDPADFSYREPKLLVAPPAEYLARHPEMEGLVAEVQFTSAIQHALDMTTHDFDYKGQSYSWQNFRLVAQLRGMLELVDRMIDDIQSVSIKAVEDIAMPPQFERGAELLEVLTKRFADEDLPRDRRRLADTVRNWSSATGIDPEELGELLDANPTLMNSESLDPVTKVLGALLTANKEALLGNFDGRLCITAELEALCPVAAGVPRERRVKLDG